tara:strand:- start:345 stop:1916 length:1572 start_codon:yes stop_codon:yes gene_type:complete
MNATTRVELLTELWQQLKPIKLTELLEVLAAAPGLAPWQYTLIKEASADGIEVPPLELVVTSDGFVQALSAVLPPDAEVGAAARIMFDSIVGTPNAVMGELQHVGGSLAMVCTDDLDAACRAAFDGFDRDRSGDLDLEELTTFLICSMRMISALRVGDNKNVEKQLQMARAMATVEFERTDLDGDGTIDFAEFRAFFMRIVTGEGRSEAKKKERAMRVAQHDAESMVSDARGGGGDGAKRAEMRKQQPRKLRADAASLVEAVRMGVAPLIRELCRAGADVEAADADGATPAFLAASRGDIDALRTLMLAGADVHRSVRQRTSAADELLLRHATIIHSIVGAEVVNHAVAVKPAGEAAGAGAEAPAWLRARVLAYDPATMVHTLKYDADLSDASMAGLTLPTVLATSPFRDVDLFGPRSRLRGGSGSAGSAESSGDGGSAAAKRGERIGERDVSHTALLQAQRLYGNERYAEAVALLRAVQERDEGAGGAGGATSAQGHSFQLILGLALRKVGMVDEAVVALNR